jgi:hypothetical protein
MKGLTVEVLRSTKFGDSSNGGVSSRFNEFILVDPQIDEVFEATAKCPALKVVRRMFGKREYVHAEPLTPVPAGCVGYMFGGNFVTSSDSRISEINQYPIPVHDRIETARDYDFLSR